MTRSRILPALRIAVVTALLPLSQAAAQRPPPAAAPAPASSNVHAVDTFKEAMGLFARGEIALACRKFEESYAEDAAPGTLYNMAICHEREQSYADAYREFDELASRAQAAGHADKASGIRARANTMLPHLARIDLVHRSDADSGVTGLSIDGQNFLADVWKKPLYVTPGAHVVIVQHADGVSVTRRTSALGAGESQRIEMENPAPLRKLGPHGRPIIREAIVVNPSRRVASYVTGAAGVALLAAGAVLGALAITEKNKFNTLCPNNSCNGPSNIQTAYDERSTAKTEANLSTVGLIAGGAAVATAIYFFVSSRETMEIEKSAWLLAPSSDGHGAGLQLGARF